jgi:hypothetical protein
MTLQIALRRSENKSGLTPASMSVHTSLESFRLPLPQHHRRLFDPRHDMSYYLA